MTHKSVEDFKVETLEIAGLHSVLEALHLPFGGENKSKSQFEIEMRFGDDGKNVSIDYGTYAEPSGKDIKLLHILAKNGDEHAKAIRGLVVYARINAPRYWWQEFDTYRIGVEKLASNSTMHQQGRGMDTDTLVEMKENLTEGTMQTRVAMLSYQALRRIYFQRREHRLPQWRTFCKWIDTLPFVNEWITFEK